MPNTIQTTLDLLPFPMTAHELEEKLHTICDAVGCWDWQVGYDPEFNRLYPNPTAERRKQMTPNIDKIVEHYNHARRRQQ